MKIINNKDSAILILKEQDLSPKALPSKGYALDIVLIPKELKEKWEISDIRMAIMPALKPTGQIFFI